MPLQEKEKTLALQKEKKKNSPPLKLFNKNTKVRTSKKQTSGSFLPNEELLQAKALLALAKDFPQSKNRILEFILDEKEVKKAKAHTSLEKENFRQGALKVLALQILVQNEKNPKILENDLEEIIHKSKDSSISKLASDALSSHKKGQDIFKDLPEALSSMPL